MLPSRPYWKYDTHVHCIVKTSITKWMLTAKTTKCTWFECIFRKNEHTSRGCQNCQLLFNSPCASYHTCGIVEASIFTAKLTTHCCIGSLSVFFGGKTSTHQEKPKLSLPPNPPRACYHIHTYGRVEASITNWILTAKTNCTQLYWEIGVRFLKNEHSSRENHSFSIHTENKFMWRKSLPCCINPKTWTKYDFQSASVHINFYKF